MTNSEKFNLIAPIAIYHFADVCFKAKSQVALKKLSKVPALLSELGIDAKIKLDDIPTLHLKDMYNKLFEELVLSKNENWETLVDGFGSFGFRDGSGIVQFTGDDAGFYPWYETAELLFKRIG